MEFLVENNGTDLGCGDNARQGSGFGGPQCESPIYGECRGDGYFYGWNSGDGEGGGHFDYDEEEE